MRGAAVANYGGGAGGAAGLPAGRAGARSPQEEDRGRGLERAAPRVWAGAAFPQRQQGRISADTHGARLQSLWSPELRGRSAPSSAAATGGFFS